MKYLSTREAERQHSKRRFKGVYKWGLAISIVIHGLIILAVSLPTDDAEARTVKDDKKMEIKVISYNELPPPPSITPLTTIPTDGFGDGDVGEIPLPVPDADADRDTIPDVVHGDYNPLDGEKFIIENDDPDKTDPSETPVFIPFEEKPVLVKEVKPEYPSLGKEAEIEGTVGLMVYVDVDGSVKNVVVTKPMEISSFNRSAVEAAYECTFTPAKMSGQPVGVWISLPMNFVLH